MVFNQTNDIFHTKHNIKCSLAMYTCGLGEKTCCYFLMYEVLLLQKKCLFINPFLLFSHSTLFEFGLFQSNNLIDTIGWKMHCPTKSASLRTQRMVNYGTKRWQKCWDKDNNNFTFLVPNRHRVTKFVMCNKYIFKILYLNAKFHN